MKFVNSSEPQFKLIESIRCGNISNWAQLEIKAMLSDVRLDDHFVYRIFEGIAHKGAYDFTKDSLGRFQPLDSIVERYPSLVCTLVRQDGIYMNDYDEFGPCNSGEMPKFSIVRLFYEADIWNPKILLHFFLKTKTEQLLMPGTAFTNGLLNLFNFTIERTKLRAKKSERFRKVYDRLLERYEDMSNILQFKS